MDRHTMFKSLMQDGRERVRKLELYKAKRRAVAQKRMEKIREKIRGKEEEYIVVRRKV